MESHQFESDKVLVNKNIEKSRKYGPDPSIRICTLCEKPLHSKAIILVLCTNCTKSIEIHEWLVNSYDASTKAGFPKSWVRPLLIELFGNQCHVIDCGWSKVHPLTGKVPLQLERIDGNPRNNFKDNLMMMCAACHSLTSTYCGLNTANSRSKYGKPLLDRIYARPERMKAIQDGLYDYR